MLQHGPVRAEAGTILRNPIDDRDISNLGGFARLREAQIDRPRDVDLIIVQFLDVSDILREAGYFIDKNEKFLASVAYFGGTTHVIQVALPPHRLLAKSFRTADDRLQSIT